jgi:hypothetical protein
MSESFPSFIKGIELCERFYLEAVRPLLDRYFPGVNHSAAKIDQGSEVLGFDTAQSRDHHWGPKVILFMTEQDYDLLCTKISEVMSEKLPFTFAGYPTNFATIPTASGGVMQFTDKRPISHGVSVHTIRGFFEQYLGIDPESAIEEKQWLTLSQQCLATVARGRVFHDGLGRLNKIQEKLRWYPRDVWIYLLACQWVRLDQEEPFTARCGDVGDELGSRIVASRQVVELMRLCFLMEKHYWPYNKWFGSAFSQLECSAKLSPILHAVLESSTWRERERHLNQAYIHVAEMHNKLGITEPVDASVSQFYDRPYTVIHAERFALALVDKVDSNFLKSNKRMVGSVDQFADSTDIFCWNEAMRSLGSVYDLGK